MRKIARDALTNSQSAQGNTQKYQLYQFANKRSVPYYIFIKPVSDRQVLFNHLLNYQTIKNPKLYLYILEGIKRSTRYTVQKKSPNTVKHLYKLYRCNFVHLANLRTKLIWVFFFIGFPRLCEVINIWRTDVFIKITHTAIFIEKCKADVCQEVSWIYLR